MSGSARYHQALESLRGLFVDYPMRAELSSIHAAADSVGQVSILVRLHTTDPMVVAAGVLEWARTLSRGRTWVWRTPNGAELHVATTGHAPECTDVPIAVLAGPVPHDCRLDHDLEPGTSEEFGDDELHHWLGAEVANNWPFPAGINTHNGAMP